MKLTSAIIMFMLAIATLVIGVLAAQTQSINMEGTINFEISDRSLYVKNVRLEDSDGTPTEITSFMPGYINDGITLSLGTHTVSNTSFKIHFDLINTTKSTYEAGDVTLSQELQTANVVASASGTISPTSETIPEGETYAPITSTTPVSGTITLFINSPNTTSIDLSGITVAIDEYVAPRNFSDEGFVINGNTITDYTGNASSIILPSRYVINEEGDYIEDLDEIGTQITIIGSYAFGSSDLTTVIIPEGIEEIQNHAFAYSRLLTEVTIPSTMRTIYSGSGHENPFCSCDALAIVYNNSSIDIASGIGTTDNGSIALCAKEVVNSGETPQGMVEISDQIQYYVNEYTGEKLALASAVAKTSLTSVTLASDTTEMNQYAFENCSNLQSVAFNNCRITSIPDFAFLYCTSLTTITIPETVTSIGNDAFSGCTSLDYNYSGIGGYLGSETNEYFALLDTTTTSFTSITINSNCKIIAGKAFQYCTSLSTITIPETVTSIGEDAFNGCSNLQSVDFGTNSSLQTIGDSAFDGCSSLTTITIPETVEVIGNYAFRDCTSLTTITIPEKVTSIGSIAFDGCSSLTTVVIDSYNIYTSANGAGGDYCGNLLLNAQIVKVPTSIVNAYDNSYLESETNFTTDTETIDGVAYTVFTKVGA